MAELPGVIRIRRTEIALGGDMQQDGLHNLGTKPCSEPVGGEHLVGVVDSVFRGVIRQVVEQMPNVMQERRGDQGAAGAAAFGKERRLDRMLLLRDRLPAVLGAAMLVEETQDFEGDRVMIECRCLHIRIFMQGSSIEHLPQPAREYTPPCGLNARGEVQLLQNFMKASMPSAAPSTDTHSPLPAGPHHDLFWAVWAVTAAFGSYFCMYAFRKPFTAAAFADTTVWTLGFKTVLITLQVIGYMVSKMIGIKVIAEMVPHRRAMGMLLLILIAEAALVMFGLLPRPWNAAFLLLNGLALGMVYGLVVGFLEGRRLTELLTAGLCASFILADGVMKSLGTWLLSLHVSEDWMPSAAGALFLPLFGLCVAMLTRLPPPTEEDVLARSRRTTMNHADRWGFLSRYAVGLVPLLLMYLVVTILRSVRSDFAPEIWRGLGTTVVPSTFAYSEMIVALGILLLSGAAVLITDNRRAFLSALATCGLGFGLLAVALIARSGGLLDSFGFMVLIGLGLYLPYVSMHTTVFERLLGITRDRGNIGFLMYVADTVGYLGYVAVMIARNFMPASGDMLGSLIMICWLAVGLSTVCLIVSWFYFSRLKTDETVPQPSVEPT